MNVSALRTLAMAALALAAAAAQAQPLDLLQAWQRARQSDAGWLAAQAATRAGVEAVPIARAALLPQVSLSAQRAHNGLDYAADAAPEQRYYGGQQSLTVRQAIYRPALRARLDQAQAEVRDVHAREAAEAAVLLTRVGEAYAEVLLASERIGLLQAQIASAELQLAAAGRTRQAGSGTRTDEDEARARLDLLQAQALEARQALTSARQGLELLLQQPVSVLMTLPDEEADSPAPAAAQTLPSLAQWLGQAEQGNPELRALQAQVDSAAHEVRRARAAHLPTLDMQLQWQHSDRDGVTAASNRYRHTQASLLLNLPLYAGGGVDAAVRQALASEERARLALEAARRDLLNRVTREWRAVVEGQARAHAYRQAVASAEQLVKATRASFSAGVRSNLDVLDAQERLATAHSERQRNRLLVLVSRLRLGALAGQADAAAIAPINAQLQKPLPLADLAQNPLPSIHLSGAEAPAQRSPS